MLLVRAETERDLSREILGGLAAFSLSTATGILVFSAPSLTPSQRSRLVRMGRIFEVSVSVAERRCETLADFSAGTSAVRTRSYEAGISILCEETAASLSVCNQNRSAIASEDVYRKSAFGDIILRSNRSMLGDIFQVPTHLPRICRSIRLFSNCKKKRITYCP